MLIHCAEALQEAHEVHRTNDGHDGQADGGVDGVAAADPVPEAKHVLSVDAEFGDLFGIRGNGDEVLGDGIFATQLLDKPAASCVSVGERLLRGEGLGSDDKQRGLRIDLIQNRM